MQYLHFFVKNCIGKIISTLFKIIYPIQNIIYPLQTIIFLYEFISTHLKQPAFVLSPTVGSHEWH